MEIARSWIPMLAAAALVLGVACGGGGGGQPTETPSVTSTPAPSPTVTRTGFLPRPTRGTPRADETSTPPPALAPTAVPPRSIFFRHADDRLRWEGPDDRVYTLAAAHCGPPEDLRRDYGIPGYIGVGDELGFWAVRAVPRGPDWRWTGYAHGDWQIRQGDDPLKVYLVHAEERRIAFEYQSYPCF